MTNLPISAGGSTRAYILVRLRRDHPALAARVEAGEISANAAAIEVGFRKKLSALDKAARVAAELSDQEWAALVRAENRRRRGK